MWQNGWKVCVLARDKPDAALEQRADDIIDIIAKAQQPDGYLNTFFTIKEPEHRWQNLLES